MVFVLNCFVFLNMVKVQTSYQGVFLFLFFWFCKKTVRGGGYHGILLLSV